VLDSTDFEHAECFIQELGSLHSFFFVAVTTKTASLLYIIIGIMMLVTAAGSAEVLLVSQS
jgi:hypothetical protein